MRTRRWMTMTVVLAVALGACGGDDTADEATQEDSVVETDTATGADETTATAGAETDGDDTATASVAAGGPTLMAASSDLGEIVVDDEGMAVYVFDNDTDGESTCYDDCAANWPPVPAPAEGGDGVEASLASTERDDGSPQATLDGQPLYYFAGDQASGDVNGQAVGGVWWVVAPDGGKVTATATGS